ncbi:hypothetical protein EQG63_11265 [Flavobacterium amnicola]|uniref:Uncharacterized protein n=1 Tax=Flavobacterium amnicola TaxID=2506422 RepID=A0A4V1N1R4_9FLAO|nr:hypothetical protein [Flavobacterium amnicola]RXR17360.1 hypothetical protein EQG63_11265 [Flavobacterium amnicola]
MKKYYHYTTEFKLEEIIESEKIKLAVASVGGKNEKACAWVSSNPQWENTATKYESDELGNYHKLTFDEQLEKYGCARIQVEPIGLIPWNKIKHLAKMDLTYAESMVKAGIEMGGKQSEWFGSLYPIGIERWIKAEVYKNGEWIEYDVFE